jgi:hypothetical protein
LPSALTSLTAVIATACGIDQFTGVKVREAGAVVTWPPPLGVTVTSLLGGAVRAA